jgi:LmbE family N-acetylglucosaminyl deacetylase
MSDLPDTVTEAVERAAESRLNSIVAILVAITATFMSLGNVKDGNIGQSMAEAQSKTVDTWSYYQAKSTKESLAEATRDQLTTMRDLTPGMAAPLRATIDARIADYNARIARYEREKNDIRKEAEGYQKKYETLNMHDDQFDLSEAALSLSIALLGVTALTQKRWLLVLAIAFILFGFFFGVAGFLGWSVHPDALSSLLS